MLKALGWLLVLPEVAQSSVLKWGRKPKTTSELTARKVDECLWEHPWAWSQVFLRCSLTSSVHALPSSLAQSSMWAWKSWMRLEASAVAVRGLKRVFREKRNWADSSLAPTFLRAWSKAVHANEFPPRVSWAARSLPSVFLDSLVRCLCACVGFVDKLRLVDEVCVRIENDFVCLGWQSLCSLRPFLLALRSSGAQQLMGCLCSLGLESFPKHVGGIGLPRLSCRSPFLRLCLLPEDSLELCSPEEDAASSLMRRIACATSKWPKAWRAARPTRPPISNARPASSISCNIGMTRNHRDGANKELATCRQLSQGKQANRNCSQAYGTTWRRISLCLLLSSLCLAVFTATSRIFIVEIIMRTGHHCWLSSYTVSWGADDAMAGLPGGVLSRWARTNWRTRDLSCDHREMTCG